MMISVHFIVLIIWMTQEFVTCVNMRMPVDILTTALGDSLTLNCTYNCSTEFVRGCWSKSSDNSVCFGTHAKCTVSLRLSNVSAEDLEKNYTCYTLVTDDPQLLPKTERIVKLKLQGQRRAPTWKVTLKTETENATLPEKPRDQSGGEFTGIKVLATVTVAVATVLTALAAYMCLNRNRQSLSCKGPPVGSRSGSPLPPHAVCLPVNGPQSTQSERVTLRIPTPDSESDTEVPYADIMITVRGVSTPELTQVGYLTPGDQREWRGDDSRCNLQASRSADRLHVPQPREVSRKMSTNSEYAVITYA
ncbi:uncharacterized protein [Labrus bergylta]|uniref:uncharacterized protein n=1 Tax=Labrus bergylta TaxID=56723 RepID=UPI003313BD14